MKHKMTKGGIAGMAETILSIEHLSVTFRQEGREYRILENFSADIYAGEVTVILGDSGSGKSTLLNVVAGFLRPQQPMSPFLRPLQRALLDPHEPSVEGRIVLAGEDITYMPPHRRDIGLVMQRLNLYPERTVEQNLKFPLRMRGKVPRTEWEKYIEQVSESLGIHELLKKKPETLSGGQEQRVAIGKMLLCFPKIALLDEAFSNLDVGLRTKLREDVIHQFIQRGFAHGEQDKQRAVLFVSHNLDDAEEADKIILLQRDEADAKANRSAKATVYAKDATGSAWEQLSRSRPVKINRSVLVLPKNLEVLRS